MAPAIDEFFDSALDNMAVAGFDGYFKRVNTSWSRTLGYTAEELLARPIVDFVHPEDREAVASGRRRLMTGGALGPLVNRYRRKDGSWRWLEWRSTASLEHRVVYAVARDVTDAKAAAEHPPAPRESRAADHLATYRALAAGLEHEIADPLAAVISNLSLLEEELRAMPTARRTDHLLAITRDAWEGAKRMRRLLRAMGTFSRAPADRLSLFDVRPLVARAVDATRDEISRRARLLIRFDDVPHVKADHAALGQVFIHLLSAAAHAIPEGDVEGNEIHVSTSTDPAGRALVCVRDTGVGLPPEVVDRLFHPFAAARAAGSAMGLGLSLSHHIIARFGGAIAVDSVAGRGTTFSVLLPSALGSGRSPDLHRL